ncbi:MAG: 50S ribosomal protein L7/L12 [Fimbriiglobus sp.]
MSKIAELGDSIAKLTLQEAVELAGYMKETYKIEPAAGGGGGGGGPVVVAPVEVKAEPTEFNVILAGFDAAKKIGVIKVVRELTGLGLGEAKAAVEGAPKALKEGVDKKTAEDIKAKLEKEGAKVEIKPV